MGSMYVPNVRVDTVDMGTSPVSNPSNLMLVINGTVYGSGYIDNPGTYQRQIFPVYVSSTNKLQLKIINIAMTANVPALTIRNIEVLAIG